MIEITNRWTDSTPLDVNELAEWFANSAKRMDEGRIIECETLESVVQFHGVTRKPTTNDYKRNTRFLQSNKKVKR